VIADSVPTRDNLVMGMITGWKRDSGNMPDDGPEVRPMQAASRGLGAAMLTVSWPPPMDHEMEAREDEGGEYGEHEACEDDHRAAVGAGPR